MSHEIAHTVAHHASERMSKSVLAIVGLLLLSVVSGTDTSFLGNIMDLVYLRPGSRRQEVWYPQIIFLFVNPSIKSSLFPFFFSHVVARLLISDLPLPRIG